MYPFERSDLNNEIRVIDVVLPVPLIHICFILIL